MLSIDVLVMGGKQLRLETLISLSYHIQRYHQEYGGR